jgi:hypothetical protein
MQSGGRAGERGDISKSDPAVGAAFGLTLIVAFPAASGGQYDQPALAHDRLCA